MAEEETPSSAEDGIARKPSGPSPVRVRFRLPLTLIPPMAGVAVAIALWDSKGEPEFFNSATHVLAIGAVALAIQGRFFRLRQHISGAFADAYAILNVVTILVATGVGLGFAFRALATGESRTPDLAMSAAALAIVVAAFAAQALFGTPGVIAEEEA